MWDRAVGDLRAAGAMVEPFAAAVDARELSRRVRRLGAARATTCAVNANSPAPTANALFRYFAGRTDDPRAAVRRGYAAYRAVLRRAAGDVRGVRAAARPADGATIRRDVRSRARAPRSSRRSRSRCARPASSAMVYPTMPFNAPRAVDPWPDIRTALGYGNWLGLAGGFGPGGTGRGWNAGAQPVDRRTAGRGRARAGAGACVRAAVAPVRPTAACRVNERADPLLLRKPAGSPSITNHYPSPREHHMKISHALILALGFPMSLAAQAPSGKSDHHGVQGAGRLASSATSRRLSTRSPRRSSPTSRPRRSSPSATSRSTWRATTISSATISAR